jgi:twitching motility protein PilT
MPDSSSHELLEAILSAAVECSASDLLLHETRIPKVRVGGRLLSLEAAPLDLNFFECLARQAGAPTNNLDHDASIVSASGHRFRVNLFTTLGRKGAVLRRIPSQIPELDTLGVPTETLRRWATSRSGFVLVCGPTGSGKSTTLAALLESLNHDSPRHVVTIEDPIEFAFTDRECLFTQREVGIDTPSFSEGLRRSLRQNPDVIFIGEIRDAVAASTALQAAETGHLVLATVHSSSAAEAVERLESLFPADEREGIRRTLAGQLLGILCQKLLPSADTTQVLACEFFSNLGILTKHISDGNLTELADEIAKGDGTTAMGFLNALAGLVRSGRLEEATALAACERPSELQRTLRGISSSSAGIRR